MIHVGHDTHFRENSNLPQSLARFSRKGKAAIFYVRANLVPGTHVPFGQHQDTELWNNQQARSQSLRVFCF